MLQLTEPFLPYSDHFENHFALTPRLIGIVNVTPNSFSDGNEYLKKESAIKRAKKLIKEGCSVLEIGGQSTHPKAAEISPEEEWRRLKPVIEAFKKEVAISAIELCVDTYRYQVAKRAMEEFGICWINDVSGGNDPKMVELIAKRGGKITLMHSVSIPIAPLEKIGLEKDPIAVIAKWGKKKVAACLKKGVTKEQILLDPGIGFGKWPIHSWYILANIEALTVLDCPLVIGHSRKAFQGHSLCNSVKGRDVESSAISLLLSSSKLSYLRVHNIKLHQRLLRVGSLMRNMARQT